ncbi:DUF2085 domain-containing protein [Methanobrevibacter sp. TMH8]|uniref:DUF2085 domain-containing protein n=1 Tax=Methanobrevibacter sp. TMH8 TaxID=2848611 RepID=UPI001CCAAC75|nr:DUF2085 domain-containing protein [Methanobrevibacter sp. TMH8]MBZ9570105.1 DUF2085 domain-containing protein [Methanobrevibacter sp. TMH8]
MQYLNFICHRIPNRTFQYRGYYFPVCARCTGFYISMVIYTLIVMFLAIEYDANMVILAIIFFIPSTLDGLSQLLGFRESNNILRLLTGLSGGMGLMIILKTLKFMFIY